MNGIVAPALVRSMTVLLTAVLVLTSWTPLSAQDREPGADKVSFYIQSADGLLEDVEYMVDDLAGRRKIWKEKVLENIELFLDGVDREKAVRIDLLFDAGSGEYYRPIFPVADLGDFRNNVEGFGITQDKKAADLYQLEEGFEGWMKIAENYALFAPTDFRILVDPKVPDILSPIDPLIQKKYDAGVIISNDDEGVEARRASLAGVRKNVLSAVKKKSTETVEEYEFRKLLTANRLLQHELLFAEIKDLQAGWITEPENNRGTGELLAKGVAGTVVDQTIQEIPKLKTKFHEVPQTENAVGSGRLLFPFVERLRERYHATLNAYEPVAAIKIDRKEDLNDSQKKAAKEAVKKTIATLNNGIDLGRFDGFFEVRKAKPDDADSSHEMVAGLRASQGNDLKEIIALLPKIRDSFSAELDVETVEGFAIHKVVLKSNVPPMVDSLFGTPCHIMLATSDDFVLFSLGTTSTDWLKEAIKTVVATEEEKTPENFLDLSGHLGPLAKALSARSPNEDEQIVRYREAVIEAFSDPYEDDFFEMKNYQKEGVIHGNMEVEPGVLRLLGILVANFADENL